MTTWYSKIGILSPADLAALHNSHPYGMRGAPPLHHPPQPQNEQEGKPQGLLRLGPAGGVQSPGQSSPSRRIC